jgi:GTP cyclohydrolase I
VFALIEMLLKEIDPTGPRDGTAETPMRVAQAWRHWCGGYAISKPEELLKSFKDGSEKYDDLVIVHNVPIYSMCEHHLAPFVGHAHIGYLPGGRVVGLSKLGRVADAFARRLQVQERLTQQIANCIDAALHPAAVGVIIRARHSCMDSRGAAIHGSVTTTSAMLGLLREETALRAEFLQLCQMAEQSK